jgi:DNA-binding SARP family transcriptional activator
VAVEYRVLGPVEVLFDGRPVRVAPRPRALLAVLILNAGQVVPTTRLIDAVWGDRPPDTGVNVIQGYVSDLRRTLGRDAVETRDPGYLMRIEWSAFDLNRFERLATDGARALDDGLYAEAADLLREALSVWRGAALADVAEGDVLRPAAARLDELRLVALERRIEAELACGRERELVGELEALTAEHPLRERPVELLMLALYRCGRQADALAAYRSARTRLVGDVGLEPGTALQELERDILRQESALDGPAVRRSFGTGSRRTILVAALDLGAVGDLVALAEPLGRWADYAIVVASAVPDPTMLGEASARVRDERAALTARGLDARAAAFTSVAPGADLARLADEQEADLLLLDAPERLLEDGRVRSALDAAPCDVAVLVRRPPGSGPVLVPFSGAEHDWAAVELGASLALSRDTALVLAGSSVDDRGRDSSRLLASVSLAAQRVLGIDAEPRLVDPTPQALVDAASDAGVVVVGLTDRWRRDGVGPARSALAASPNHPTLLVRRGLRPGTLAPSGSETRFTWTIAE